MRCSALILTLLLVGIIEDYLCGASVPVCITTATETTIFANSQIAIKSSTGFMNSELRAGAQAYVPLEQSTPIKSGEKCGTDSSQSSRYSRKTVRVSSCMAGDSPRPILGTKVPFPRAILGRKEQADVKGSNNNKCLAKEFKCLTRSMQRVNLSDERLKSTPKRANSCGL